MVMRSPARSSRPPEADAALEKAQLSAAYEDFSSRRRYALTEISQLRRRWAEKSTHRLEQETKAAEIRQTVLGDLSKLRELEAERMAADTRLGFLKSKSGWLQNAMGLANTASKFVKPLTL